jgi:hypothetical protein
VTMQGVKDYFLRNPIALQKKRDASARLEATDQYRLMRQLRSEGQRKVKRAKDLSTYIANIQGMTASEIADDIMNTPQEKLAKLSVVDYATHVGGVYMFYRERNDVYGIDVKSTRFLTSGQRLKNNAVLMWNPSRVQFTDNICPYKERLDSAFATTTKTDCLTLFIDYITIVDAEMTRTEALLIEKACHDKINGLKLGTQRLHRVPGEHWSKYWKMGQYKTTNHWRDLSSSFF